MSRNDAQRRFKLIFAIFAILAALDLIATASAQIFSSSSTSSLSSSSSTSVVRLRPSRLRHRPPESCRESLPRKSEDLPALVITGRVKEVYLANEVASAQSSATNGSTGTPSQQQQSMQQQMSGDTQMGAAQQNRALVNIARVIKGNKQLTGSDIVVSGFNSSSSMPCPNYVIPNDTLIFLLEPKGDKKYSIQGSHLLSMNLNNLDRINAIAADEVYKRRPQIEDILCEAHYCPYGRCVVDDRNQTSCQCPETCPPVPAPVCGSDYTTYPSECHLIKEGCRRQKPLFVTKEAAC